jgi:hypothetical protein
MAPVVNIAAAIQTIKNKFKIARKARFHLTSAAQHNTEVHIATLILIEPQLPVVNKKTTSPNGKEPHRGQ